MLPDLDIWNVELLQRGDIHVQFKCQCKLMIYGPGEYLFEWQSLVPRIQVKRPGQYPIPCDHHAREAFRQVWGIED